MYVYAPLSVSTAHLDVQALRDVGERQQLPPLLAPALAVVRPALLRLDVHRVRHDVLKLHELHLAAVLFWFCFLSSSAAAGVTSPQLNSAESTALFTLHQARPTHAAAGEEK